MRRARSGRQPCFASRISFQTRRGDAGTSLAEASHGGGATGYAFGRMASAAKKRPWATESLRQDGAFEALLHRLWFDVHVHDPDALALLQKKVNPEHLVFGTNFAGWDQQPGDVRHEAAPYTENARRLLRAT